MKVRFETGYGGSNTNSRILARLPGYCRVSRRTILTGDREFVIIRAANNAARRFIQSGMFHLAYRWIMFSVEVYDPAGLRYQQRETNYGTRFDYNEAKHDKRIESELLYSYVWFMATLQDKYGNHIDHFVGPEINLRQWQERRTFLDLGGFVDKYLCKLTDPEIQFVIEAFNRGAEYQRFKPRIIPRPRTKPINLLAAIGSIKI